VLTLAMLLEIMAVACDCAERPETPVYNDPNKLMAIS